MSQDRPDIADILATVQDFVERITARLEGEDRYHAQVASYLLGIGKRELLRGSTFDALERKRLTEFLGRQGSLAVLTRDLCTSIRAGRFDERWDETLALVLQEVVDKVNVVRPDHLASEHAQG
jgi:hypothetical protein